MQKKILVVDDDIFICNLLSLFLSDIASGVLIANDGLEGISQIKAHEEDINCIVCDIKMPNMDGPTFFKEIRKNSCNIPVIFFSAYGDDSSRKTIEQGNSKLILKPDKDQLKSEVQKIIIV